jgi:Flp pilus assembly protein TadD
MWVHLFEPHAPYAPGSPDGRSASDRYDDDVAAADREIARLLEAWRDRPDALIVATADHGEAFGEHGEHGHSIFVYDTTLRVPLIAAGPGVAAEATIDTPVTLADMAPTLARASGLPPFDADGAAIDLRSGGGLSGDRALYAESFAPLLDFGWAPLRSLRRGRLKLIAAPRPELYDVAADADERQNVIEARAADARELTSRIDRIAAPDLPAQRTPVDRDTAARLRALGYFGSGGSPAATARPDPKDRIAIASRLAAVTSGEARGADAERALRAVLQEDSGNPQAHLRLGFLLAESGRCTEAERHFAAAIAARLPTADAHLGLAGCQAARGAWTDALALLRTARETEPGNPVVDANIGILLLEEGRPADAVPPLRAALAADADLHQARFALARALARTGQRHAALGEARLLLQRLPAAAPQRPEVERLVAALQ